METSNIRNVNPGRRILLVGLIVTTIAYSGGLTGQFVFDDPPQIVENKAVHSWEYVPKYFTSDVWPKTDSSAVGVYYRPVFQLWLLINYKIGGLNTTSWHLSGLLLHLLVTLLVFELIRTILKDELAAGITAFLFGLHPVHVESVTWISGVTDPLMAIPLVASLICFVSSGKKSNRVVWLLASWILYAVAIFSKETAIVLPALVFLYRWFWSRSEDSNARVSISQRFLSSLIDALPYILITLAYLVARYAALKSLSHSMTPLPLSTLVYTWPSVLLFYVRLMLWPFGLSVFYDTPYVTSPNLDFVFPLIVLVIIVVAVYLRTKANRAAQFFALWIILPILPLLNLTVFSEGELAHDRYMYLPSIGLCVLVAMVIRQINVGSPMFGLSLGQALSLVALGLLFGLVTFRQTGFWSSELTLAARGVEIAPNNTIANNNLGKELALKGDYQQAVPLFLKVLKRRPNYWLTNFNLGFVYYRLGDLPQAELYLRRAIAIFPNDPPEHRYLGFTLLEMKRNSEAETELRAAIASQPNAPDQHFALGVILEEKGTLAEALTAYKKEREINPKRPEVNDRIAALESRLSRSSSQ